MNYFLSLLGFVLFFLSSLSMIESSEIQAVHKHVKWILGDEIVTLARKKSNSKVHYAWLDVLNNTKLENDDHYSIKDTDDSSILKIHYDPDNQIQLRIFRAKPLVNEFFEDEDKEEHIYYLIRFDREKFGIYDSQINATHRSVNCALCLNTPQLSEENNEHSHFIEHIQEHHIDLTLTEFGAEKRAPPRIKLSKSSRSDEIGFREMTAKVDHHELVEIKRNSVKFDCNLILYNNLNQKRNKLKNEHDIWISREIKANDKSIVSTCSHFKPFETTKPIETTTPFPLTKPAPSLNNRASRRQTQSVYLMASLFAVFSLFPLI